MQDSGRHPHPPNRPWNPKWDAVTRAGWKPGATHAARIAGVSSVCSWNYSARHSLIRRRHPVFPGSLRPVVK